MSRLRMLVVAVATTAALPAVAQTTAQPPASSSPSSPEAGRPAEPSRTQRATRPTAAATTDAARPTDRRAGGSAGLPKAKPADVPAAGADSPAPPARRITGRAPLPSGRPDGQVAATASPAAVATIPAVSPQPAPAREPLLPTTNWFSTFFGGAPVQARNERLPALAGRSQIDALIAHHAKLNGVPESLVHRVVIRESKYNPRAVGAGGAMGLMQIKTATARGLGYPGGPAGLLDAETNLTYAVKYLAGAYRTADGNHDLAVGYYARGYFYDAKRKGMVQTASGETVHPSQIQGHEAPVTSARRGSVGRSVAALRPVVAPQPAVTASAGPAPVVYTMSPAMERAGR